jgi:hypothetical protein
VDISAILDDIKDVLNKYDVSSSAAGNSLGDQSVTDEEFNALNTVLTVMRHNSDVPVNVPDTSEAFQPTSTLGNVVPQAPTADVRPPVDVPPAPVTSAPATGPGDARPVL